MKSEEKSTNKEKKTLIIRKYHQYLKLEKALSPNTVDAYQTDLQKLLHFLEGEGIACLLYTSLMSVPLSPHVCSVIPLCLFCQPLYIDEKPRL